MNNNSNNNNNRGNNNRRRGRGGNRPQGGGQQLNRIDSRARGNAPQMLEKYRKLAHDAHLNGDRVQEETYLQYADHYFRVIADTRVRLDDQRTPRRDERWQEGDSDREEGEDASEYSADGEYQSYDRPQYNRTERAERTERPERAERPERIERPAQVQRPEAQREEPVEDVQTGNDASNDKQDSATSFEPPENPFVRENRGTGGRGLRPRRDDRRPRRDAPADQAGNEDEPRSLDPAILPPAISVSRDETPRDEPVADAANDEVNARPRRTRRPRPPADDAGGTLEAAN